MNREAKLLINSVLAVVAIAMGASFIVLSILELFITPRNHTIMLAIAVIAIGLLELNNMSKSKKTEFKKR